MDHLSLLHQLPELHHLHATNCLTKVLLLYLNIYIFRRIMRSAIDAGAQDIGQEIVPIKTETDILVRLGTVHDPGLDRTVEGEL